MNTMQELYKALNAFQAELVTVAKSADNPFFKSKYAPLDEIMKSAQPVLTKHGLSVVQLPTQIDGAPALRTIVAHTSGQVLEDTAPLLLAKSDPQGLGSAITYMRRYSYAAALGIVIDEDDDGNSASKPVAKPVAQPQSAPKTSNKPSGKLVTEGQVKLLLARSRDFSGRSERQDIIDWFVEIVGKQPNEVTMDDMDATLKVIEEARV